MFQGGLNMDAIQKILDAFKAILGYFEVFMAEIKAALGLGETEK